MRRLLLAAVLTVAATSVPSADDLRGHGGPVRGLAVSADGGTALSGSFDSSAIAWSLTRGSAEQVLRFHGGAVNAVLLLADGRRATAGEDGTIALWRPPSPRPVAVLRGHSGPIVALAASADGRRLGSAAWDGTGRVWPLDGNGPTRVLEGHEGNVNGIGFLADGAVATIGYDATLRIWPETGPPVVRRLPAPQNVLAVLADGRVAVGGADGRLRLLTPDGRLVAETEVAPTPVIALAAAPDGKRLAAAGLQGAIAVLDAADLAVERQLIGPGLPVWSLAFRPGTDELLSGGGDGVVRRWNVETEAAIGAAFAGRPADPLAPYAGDPGAEVFRACVACHTLRSDEGARAGPTLHGVMGRRIGSLPGYDYSPAFSRLGIVWTPETIARLFEVGPHAFTPGTRMPEQRIVRAVDRAALVRFLERATATD